MCMCRHTDMFGLTCKKHFIAIPVIVIDLFSALTRQWLFKCTCCGVACFM